SSRTVIPRSWRYSFKRCPMWVSTKLLRSMGIILVPSPLYFILRAKFAKPISSVLARSSCGVVAWGCSDGFDCEFCWGCPLIGGTPPLRLPVYVLVPLWGPPRRSKPIPLLKPTGRRRLIPNLEQVTCREPTVTPIKLGDLLSALSSLNEVPDLLESLRRKLYLSST